MHNESPQSPEHWLPEEEEALDDAEDLKFCQHEVRRLAKDLLDTLHDAPESFPNRDRVVEISNEILTLVPVANQRLEDVDDMERKRLYAQIEEVARKLKSQRE